CGAPPSITKLTLPVGVPAPVASVVTVAVKVTLWPVTDGFCEDTSSVLVPAFWMVSVKLCVALLPMPLLAVIRQLLYAPTVPAGAVPASVAVPLPLSVKVIAAGFAGVHAPIVSVGGGKPVAVTLK